MALEALPFGLAIGLAVGALGGGGSVLAVPVLVYVLGQGVQEATTASLAVVAAGAVAGGLAHHREDRVCWRHAATFTAAALPGILAGTAAGGAVGGSLLIAAFALVMVGAAVAVWRNADAPRDPEAASAVRCPPLRIARDALAGLAIGFMTGFFGVGGGFLIVPALAIALAFSMRLAVGTSLAIIAATALVGLVVHLLAGRTLDPGVTLAMSAACAAGAVAGAGLVGRVRPPRLAHGFAALLTAVAAYLIVSVALLGGPPGAS